MKGKLAQLLQGGEARRAQILLCTQARAELGSTKIEKTRRPATHRSRTKRALSFEQDYTALLLSLASSVRTGLDPLQALINSAELFTPGSIIQEELKKLRERIETGMPEEEAIRSFGESVSHPDVRLFSTAFILARRAGSSLAPCLQRLARVTRQRQSFRRKMRAAIAMQRLSSFGIGACAILIASIQVSTNAKAFLAAFEHPMGSKLLSVGVALMVGGMLWMARMTRSSV